MSDIITEKFEESDEQDKYKVTLAISKFLFGAPGVQAINFPSFANYLNTINICLPAEVADTFFVPSEAWMAQVGEHVEQLPGLDHVSKDGFHQITFLRRSESIDSDWNIHWSDVLTNVSVNEIEHLVWNAQLPTALRSQAS